MEAFVTSEEAGPYPVVIFYQDSVAIREEFYDMCRRIGTVSYFVAMPNLFYRTGRINDVEIDPNKIRLTGAGRAFSACRDLTQMRLVRRNVFAVSAYSVTPGASIVAVRLPQPIKGPLDGNRKRRGFLAVRQNWQNDIWTSCAERSRSTTMPVYDLIYLPGVG